MSDGTMRAVYYLVVGAVFLGGSGCSAPDPEPETASLGTAKQALDLPPLPPLPAVPLPLRENDGVLSSAWLPDPVPEDDPLDANDACKRLHTEYGIPVGSSPGTVDTAKLLPFKDYNNADQDNSYTCAEFRDKFLRPENEGKAVITHSVKIDPCPSEVFEDVELEIAAPNVQLHCGDNTFKGAGQRKYGLTLSKNADDSLIRGDLDESGLKTITNVHISHCKFEDYQDAGVLITSKLNRYNKLDQLTYDTRLGNAPAEPWDSLDAPSPAADYLRLHTASGFYLGDITVKDVESTAIYLQDHVQNIDINRLHVRDTRVGVYMDHGSRFNTVRNSCFLQQKLPPEVAGPREFIAVDASAGNTIKSNLFYKNTEAAVRLYKNCSEYVQRPHQFFRRQTPHKNTISSNVIVGPDDPAQYNSQYYAAINIASRQWHLIAAEDYYYVDDNGNHEAGIGSDGMADVTRCGDKDADLTSEDYRFQDYAEDNQVLANVFFGPGLAVWVQDDSNLVYGNTLYLMPGALPFVRVGTDYDLTYRGRPTVDNALIKNHALSIPITAPTSVPPALFEFVEESMERTEFAGNLYKGHAVCRSPFYVPSSSNVQGEVCRFGSVDAPTLYLKGEKKPFTDGGRIHGAANVECTDDGWLMHYGSYCCTGDGCTKTPLAGQYVDSLP